MNGGPEVSGLTLHASPQGRLSATPSDAVEDRMSAEAIVRLQDAFARGIGPGLLQLGAGEPETELAPAFGYFRELGVAYIRELRLTSGEAAEPPERVLPPPSLIGELSSRAPLMPGGEYVTEATLADAWVALDATAHEELAANPSGGLEAWLRSRHPAWSLVGRVHFHLAEKKGDSENPFAFLATYSVRRGDQVVAQHRPLGQALREYSSAGDREGLLALLTPVHRAAEKCDWLRDMVENGEIFQPLRWSAGDAMQLLRDLPVLESCGVVLRMPAAWGGRRPSRPRVGAAIGGKAPAGVGIDALLDFRVQWSVDGEPLTELEWQGLLSGGQGLRLLRGRWVEVDPKRLEEAWRRLHAAEDAAREGGVSFSDAVRMMADPAEADAQDGAWSGVTAGPWLSATLETLRNPSGEGVDPGEGLHATLRPYQRAGLAWLYFLYRLRLGGCLADDMGLGKTVQVLALLVVLQRDARGRGEKSRPHLLVLPASLIGNWVLEAARFAPGLRLLVAHPSVTPAATLEALSEVSLGDIDLVVTSYGSVQRQSWMNEVRWGCLILDEAQAIKNPATRQAIATKKLSADWRLALTGTPVENRLADLWSLFDFASPGLLGTAKTFGAVTGRLSKRPTDAYGPVRELIRPYVLRRMKTDKSIAPDLPDKTEVTAFCALGRVQSALYQHAVEELREKIATLDGIARRGMVLAYLTRFKQICNHPSHWLADGVWAPEDSGKFDRLRELCEGIALRQEKVLVFTQFRETTGPLSAFLTTVFGRSGLVLHGDTPVRERQKLVTRFQEDESLPFFVLSLKAGGTGLTLTAASHVIHFDRWWNPAVENQATDRAYRIGQRRNVLVHKFVSIGTLEEKIDALIQAKQSLAGEILAGGEVNLTELSNEALIQLVSLDIRVFAGNE